MYAVADAVHEETEAGTNWYKWQVVMRQRQKDIRKRKKKKEVFQKHLFSLVEL